MEPTEEEMRAYAERAAALEAKYASAQGQETELPSSLPSVNTNDQGGEISMNVDDTNKLRIALGLKPLQSSSAATGDEAKAEHRRHQHAQAAREKKASEDAAREKIAAAKERRRLDASLKKTKALGAGDVHDDDVGSWLRAQKAPESQPKVPNNTAKDADQPSGSRRSKRVKSKDVTEEDINLKGVKVKGSAVDLEAGETMILTLADTGILAEDGNIAEEADVLENYDKVQQEQIDRAKRKSKKKNLHFEEDGKVHSMLSKYDEEEAEMLLELENDATVDDRALKASVAARLEAAAPPDQFRSLEEKYGRVNEYLTAAEVQEATFKKRKKRGEGGGKARKVRKRVEAADEEDGGGGAQGGEATGSLFDDLEAAAMEVDNVADRGNRQTRRLRDAEIEVQEAEEKLQRSRRFDLALEKANYAAMAARAQDNMDTDDAIGATEDEKQLESMLAKARSRTKRERLAEAPEGEEDDLAKLAEAIHKDRDEEEKAELLAAPDGDILGETHDFVSGLVVEAPVEDDLPDGMPIVEEDAAIKEEPEAPPPPADVGGWVAANPDPEADTADLATRGGGAPRGGARKFRNKGAKADASTGEGPGLPEAPPEGGMDAMLPSMGRQAGIRRGLAAALQLLRDTGALKDTVSWAGRSSDHKGHRLEKVKEALLDDDDELAAEVAAALQRRDEFGRIQTPKESFRDISYAFHGMTRAVSKKEKNMKAVTNEINAKSALSADNPSQLLDLYKAGLWKPPRGKKVGIGKGGGKKGEGKSGGKGGGEKGAKPAHTRSEAPGLSGMVTPALGGRDTPLEGAKKVEAMYPGLKQPE